MTRKLPSGCTHVDASGPCPEYAVERGRCEDHPRIAWNHGGKSRQQRGYDAQWDKLAKQQLRRHPVCQWPGCEDAAVQADHIIPLGEGGARLDPGNVQSLCLPHHGVKTRAESSRARTRTA